MVIRQESDEENGSAFQTDNGETTRRRAKRPREDSNEDLFVNDDVSEDEGFRRPGRSSIEARVDDGMADTEADGETDDKKKLGMKTSYDGFSIYGRVLCLVVKRKGLKGSAALGGTGGQQMLENWVSTQAAQEQTMLDEG